MARLRNLTAALLLLTALTSSAPLAQAPDDARRRAERSVVMIQTTLPDGNQFGAGIVVAASGQDLYVATADHLVRQRGEQAKDIRVQFSTRRGEWFAAQLLDLQDPSLDLAVIRVSPPQSVPAATFADAAMAPPSAMTDGADVYAVGFAAGTPWNVSRIPEKLASAESVRLVFQSAFVRPGSSGGALLDACGRIMGMVYQANPPEAEAVRIDVLLDAIRRWKLQTVVLTAAASSACGGNAPPAMAAGPAPPPRAPSIDEVRALHAQERWAESMPLLNRLLADQPAAPSLLALRAHAYTHLNMVTEALADGDQAVRLGPNVAEAYLRRGEARMGQNRYADALTDLNQALKLDPQEMETWLNRAVAYANTGQLPQARQSIDEAVRLAPQEYQPWAVRSDIQGLAGNQPGALEDINRALSLRPNNGGLYGRRAGIHFAMSQLDAALADASQALRLEPDDVDLLVTRGAVYMALGRTEAAREDLGYALRLRPGYSPASDLLAKLPAPTAPPPVGAGVSDGSSASMAYARLHDDALAAVRNGRSTETQELIRQMIRLDPARPEAYALSGMMSMWLSNNLPAAYEAYQMSLDRDGAIVFRVAHDHSTEQPPCFGMLAFARNEVTYAGEGGGHQFTWPMGAITEAAINAFYGSGIGMFHIRAQEGTRSNTFNFAVVRPTDAQIVNRRADAEMLLGFLNRLRQSATR